MRSIRKKTLAISSMNPLTWFIHNIVPTNSITMVMGVHECIYNVF